jgi:hypothetical protein
MSTIQGSLKLRLKLDDIVDDMTVIMIQSNIQARLPILILLAQIDLK